MVNARDEAMIIIETSPMSVVPRTISAEIKPYVGSALGFEIIPEIRIVLAFVNLEVSIDFINQINDMLVVEIILVYDCSLPYVTDGYQSIES